MNPNIEFTKDTFEEKITIPICFRKEIYAKIITNIYYKMTDAHQSINYGSFHPHHTKTYIPYNLARRICIIVSEKRYKRYPLK